MKEENVILFKTPKINEEENELFIRYQYATTHESKEGSINSEFNNGLRIFRTTPGCVSIQIRANSKLNPFGKGKSHQFYSTVQIDKGEIEAVIRRLQAMKEDL